MRKIYVICLVLIVFSQAIWSNGHNEGPNDSGYIFLPDGKEIEFMGIKLTADYSKELGDLKVYALEASMKDVYKERDKFHVKGLDWGGIEIHKSSEDGNIIHTLAIEKVRNEGFIYPMFNLDIFVEANGEKFPISKYNVSVTVKIPHEILKTANSSRAVVDQILFVFDDDIWMPVDDPRSGIIEVKHFHEYIEFIIIDWPADDKMFCSGP